MIPLGRPERIPRAAIGSRGDLHADARAAAPSHALDLGSKPVLRPSSVPENGSAPAAASPAVSLLVDARGLEQSGIGRYLRELLQRFFRDPSFARFTLLGPPGPLTRFVERHGRGVETHIVPFDHGFYSAVAQAHWAALSLRGRLRADVVFFPHYDAPVWPLPIPSVVTVQDLTHFKLVDENPAWKRRLAGVVLGRAVRRATRVVVPSAASAADLIAREPGVEPRLSVVYDGVGDEFSGRRDSPAGRPARELAPYLLCVGNRKGFKNLTAAVEVLARLRGEMPGLRLVLVGHRFPEDDGVAARARRLGVADAVVELEGVSDVELHELYAGAECFLFPSFYEGFGLPPLEAMASGVPVVASNRTSIPEVVRDAGVLVDPQDWEGMATAVRRLVQDRAFREEMVQRGQRRAACFTWEETARRIADLIVEAAATPRKGR